jgi:hypothetical protein
MFSAGFMCQPPTHMQGYAPRSQAGLVGCTVLSVYSIGRILFFSLREDECFKSNR